MSVIVKNLDVNEIARAHQQGNDIAASAKPTEQTDQFVFFAGFDGTMNDRSNVMLSKNPQSTNVAAITEQVEKQAVAGADLVAKYYPGPGTSNALPNSAIEPTEQVLVTAKNAYSDFAREASTWLETHPDQPVTAMVTSFSRGGSSAAIFSQLLYEKGLVDPSSGKILIPPGQVGVSAGLIYDPVYTGVGGLNSFNDPNLAFAPNARNITVVCAENEYRSAFLAVDYSDSPNVTTVGFMGNHCDIGGGYDNGLGAIALDAGTRFFQKSGLDIEADLARAFDATKPVTIHSEEIDAFNKEKWTVYGSVDLGTKRMFEDYTTPAQTSTSEDGTITTSFTAQNGHRTTDVISKNPDGTIKEQIFTVRELGGLYKEYRFDAQKKLTGQAENWRDGADRDVRHETDFIAKTYHDYVHENAEADSKVVWEAWDWKDEQGREVRREFDHTTDNYHDYVHATEAHDSEIIWEAYNWKDGAGREVRAEVDNLTGLYHHYVHASADPQSEVVWEARNWKNDAGRDVREEVDKQTGLYHHYLHASADPNSEIVWEAQNRKDDLGREVREEIDKQTGLYHHYVHATADPNSEIVWEARNWKDNAGRDVREEVDKPTGLYHHYVHASADQNSEVVWEAQNRKDDTGRDVRQEIDKQTGLYHHYVHASADPNSEVVWEAMNWKDSAGRDVRHETDKTNNLYHDYIHASADANSTVIWEAWNAKDASGRDVRHERDHTINTYHDYVHANGEWNAPIVEESWSTVSGDGFNQFKATYANGSGHFDYTKADGSTGWADFTGDDITAWDSTTKMAVMGVVGLQPNPAYTGGYLSCQSPYIAQYGTISGELHQWFHSANDYGWHYSSSKGMKYKTMNNGSLSSDAALANPISGANPAVLQTNTFDNWGLPSYNGFEFDDYLEGHLAAAHQSEMTFA